MALGSALGTAPAAPGVGAAAHEASPGGLGAAQPAAQLLRRGGGHGGSLGPLGPGGSLVDLCPADDGGFAMELSCKMVSFDGKMKLSLDGKLMVSFVGWVNDRCFARVLPNWFT
eukprot:Skav208145  [mRNA]  locus=scaffold235:208112:209489:+ [translate_table: standard]